MSSQTRMPEQAIAPPAAGKATPGPSGADGGVAASQASLAVFGNLMTVLLQPSPDPAQAKALYEALEPAHKAMVMRDRNLMPKMVAALQGGASEEEEAPEQTSEEGWGLWLKSTALEVLHAQEAVNPGLALAHQAVSAVMGGDESDADVSGNKNASTEPAAKTPAPAAGPALAPAKVPPKAPAAPVRAAPRAAPEAAAPVTGMDAVASTTLDAAEGYLPTYDDDGKLVSGVGTYGFKQSKMINDDGKRSWSEGADAGDGKAYTGKVAEGEADSKQAGLTQLWCSGLSCATLDDIGYDLDAPIEEQYYWEGGLQKNITLRMVIEGMPEALAQTEEQDTFVTEAVATFKAGLADQYEAANALEDKKAKKEAIAALDDQVSAFKVKTLYSLTGNFGASASDDDARVKGAAGAFELAGIGAEIKDITQVRPGDFCQNRDVNAPKGHAYQLHSVLAVGDVLMGAPGSPVDLVQGVEAPEEQGDGTQLYRNATFRMTATTNPNTVLFATAKKWSVIESNTAKSVGEKERSTIDREGDGGVMVRADKKIPTDPTGATRVYAGRLASSAWYGRTEA